MLKLSLVLLVTFLSACTAILFGFSIMALKSYILCDLVTWFLVPLGVKPFDVPAIFGVLLVIDLVKNCGVSKVKTPAKLQAEAEESIGSLSMRVFFNPVLALLFFWWAAWLAHTYLLV